MREVVSDRLGNRPAKTACPADLSVDAAKRKQQYHHADNLVLAESPCCAIGGVCVICCHPLAWRKKPMGEDLFTAPPP